MLDHEPEGIGETRSETMSRAVSDRYLTYAISTIVARALPDARDGLKPVHRRIIHAMNELKLSATGPFRKSAKIAGDVMGNFHPHGDAAIYDAMVRMAQDFSLRYPLVDGQGNFGNIDGDAAAAARYTEARLPVFSEMLLAGINEEAVPFKPNYDGTLKEPVVMPGAFPNLLANGSSGIAVGMATNVPPHNMAELIDACELLIDNPQCAEEDLFAKVPGPDFPTGGLLVDKPEVFAEVYRTGRGSIRVRSRWETEDLGRGNWQIVITEIPYGVQKSKLIEKLAALVDSKKIPAFADVRDESAEDIRIVIEPKNRTVEPDALMEMLFRASELETRFAVNMNVLVDGRVPRVCGLRELLEIFIAHRREVLVNRSVNRLSKVDARLEIIAGHIIAYLNLDRVIEILRNEADPKAVMAAEFGLSDVQAEAILNMRLRSLRKLEEAELLKEQSDLLAEQDKLRKLIESRTLQMRAVRREVTDLRKVFGKGVEGCDRRSTFAEAGEAAEIPVAMMIEREPVTVILSKMGWIRSAKGHNVNEADLKFKDGDELLLSLKAETTDKLALFAENGKVYTIQASTLPNGRSVGEPVRLMIDLPQDSEIVTMSVWSEGAMWLLANKAGEGFRISGKDVLAQTRTGRQVMSVTDDLKLAYALPQTSTHVAVLGDNKRFLVFAADEIPVLAKSKGVRLQKYAGGKMADIAFIRADAPITWPDGAGRTRRENPADWLGKRAGVGKPAPRGMPDLIPTEQDSPGQAPGQDA